MDLYGLSQEQRKTTGEIPPASVGSSVTVVGKRVYVVAGRLVEEKAMTADVYVLDLETYVWSRVAINGTLNPPPRYFHSANAHGNLIVIFGGMSAIPSSDALCVLNDLAIFDTITNRWTLCPGREDGSMLRPRYAHLSSISAGKLVIIGGQDKMNAYLEDAGIFDLAKLEWDGSYPIVGQSGAYRSLTVTSTRSIIDDYPADVFTELQLAEDSDLMTSVSPVSSRDSWSGSTRYSTGHSFEQSSTTRRPSAASVTSLPTTNTPHRPNLRKKADGMNAEQNEHHTVYKGPSNPIYLYSNFNFVDVERHLHIIDPPRSGLVMRDLSDAIKGEPLPPGLRFPNGAIVGEYLIISGTYLTNSSQIFAIWAMHLTTSLWSRIELSPRLMAGSWNRGLHCDALERYLVLGNRDRSLVEDYNHRQVNFDHVLLLDLEAFGIFEPSMPTMSPLARHLGSLTLSDPALCDMEIITREQTSIPVSSEVLRMRWPEHLHFMTGEQDSTVATAASLPQRTDERLRSLCIPYSHALVHTFVQFLYTDSLPMQAELPSSLLYSLMLFLTMTVDRGSTSAVCLRLLKLCRERLHTRLSLDNASSTGEVCLLTGQYGLHAKVQALLANAMPKHVRGDSLIGEVNFETLAVG